MGNPAEETCCHPNTFNLCLPPQNCQPRILRNSVAFPGVRTPFSSRYLNESARKAVSVLFRRSVLVRSGVAKACHRA